MCQRRGVRAWKASALRTHVHLATTRRPLLGRKLSTSSRLLPGGRPATCGHVARRMSAPAASGAKAACTRRAQVGMHKNRQGLAPSSEGGAGEENRPAG